MQLTTTLQISEKQFFDIICKSVHDDLGDTCTIKQGLSYEKPLQTALSGSVTVKVSILEYLPYSLYSATFENTRSKTTMTYKIDAIDTNKISLTYEESAEYYNTIDKWNYKAVTFLYQKSRTKKMLKNLKALEQSITQQEG